MEFKFMSYFKKFTDFCAGIAAFVAALFLLRHYMEFSPPNTEADAPSKFSQFLTDSATADYKMIISLVLLLTLSVVISIVFRKLPYVGFAFSIIPAAYIGFMFESNILYEQELLFLAASALHVIGNLVECIWRDKEDGSHRLFIASKLSFVIGALCCFYMVLKLSGDKPMLTKDTNTFENKLFYHNEPADINLILALGIMMAVFAVICILLYNVYFIDAILSLVSLGYVLVTFTFGKLTFLPFFFLCLTAIAALSNILLAFFENNLSKKEQRHSN